MLPRLLAETQKLLVGHNLLHPQDVAVLFGETLIEALPGRWFIGNAFIRLARGE